MMPSSLTVDVDYDYIYTNDVSLKNKASIFFQSLQHFGSILLVLQGDTICESDDLQCLNNAPSISIDGIPITELIPFALPSLLIIINKYS